jgi:hypothetical protein
MANNSSFNKENSNNSILKDHEIESNSVRTQQQNAEDVYDKSKYGFESFSKSRSMSLPINLASQAVRISSSVMIASLPALASTAGVMAMSAAGSLTFASIIDGTLNRIHLRKIKKDPEVALDYYKREALYGKKYWVAGPSLTSKYIDGLFQVNKNNYVAIKKISENPEHIKNAENIHEFLKLSEHEFFISEVKFFLSKFSEENVKEIGKNIPKRGLSIFNNKEETREQIIDRVSNKFSKIIIRIAKDNAGEYSRMKSKAKKAAIEELNSIWEKISYNKKTDENFNLDDFNKRSAEKLKNFKIFNANLMITYRINGVITFLTKEKGYLKDTKIGKDSKNLEKWIKEEVNEYKKLPDYSKSLEDLKNLINNRIDKELDLKNGRRKSVNRDKNLYKEIVNNKISEMFQNDKILPYLAQRRIRNNLGWHGVGNTVQATLSLGTLGLIIPPLAPMFGAMAVVALTVGSIATAYNFKTYPKAWQKKFDAYKTTERYKENRIIEANLEKNLDFEKSIEMTKEKQNANKQNIEKTNVNKSINVEKGSKLTKTRVFNKSYNRLIKISQQSSIKTALENLSNQELELIKKDINKISRQYKVSKVKNKTSTMDNKVIDFVGRVGEKNSSFKQLNMAVDNEYKQRNIRKRKPANPNYLKWRIPHNKNISKGRLT